MFLAFAIDDLVTFIALFADSLFGIKLLAGLLDLTADAIFVKVEPIRALETRILAPDFATEVIV